MKKTTTIWVRRTIKEKLNKIKLCPDETYNSLLLRLIKNVK